MGEAPRDIAGSKHGWTKSAGRRPVASSTIGKGGGGEEQLGAASAESTRGHQIRQKSYRIWRALACNVCRWPAARRAVRGGREVGGELERLQ
jgi:hypothetical protein